MTLHITRANIQIQTNELAVAYPTARHDLARALDNTPGLLLYSNYEFPGRYSRFDIGFLNPPLQFESSGLSFALALLAAAYTKRAPQGR